LYRRTVLAAILSLVFAATALPIFNAFDLDDWNNLTKSQVEKILVKQHHATSASCTDIPNDGDETLRGYVCHERGWRRDSRFGRDDQVAARCRPVKQPHACQRPCR
jgi:hypothetical protein